MANISTRPTRSWLFTPGTRAERFANAAAIAADVLIIDLEDSVGPAEKAATRVAVLDWLDGETARHKIIGHALRINALDTAAGIADLHALLDHAADPDYIVLPKTESGSHIAIIDRLLTTAGKSARIVGIIESARGLADVDAIAVSSERLTHLMFGAADMAADLGCSVSWEPLASARSQVVAACARVGNAAIDSPFFDIRDPHGCAVEASRAVDFGFTAKAAIHPSHIAPINAALTPSSAAIEKARAILAENAKGIGTIDGKMVDEAVARKARRLLAAVGE